MGRRTDPDEPPLVRFSAALTGREQSLVVAMAISEEGPINATAVADTAGVPVDAASRELRVLEKAGFLKTIKTERATTDFEIVDKTAWVALGTLCERATEGRLVSRW